VILIVARHSLRNLLCGELAVIFGMQNVGERTRIRGHRLKAPYFLNVDIVANAAAWSVPPMPVEIRVLLRRVG
jgi:hypothetical protein